MKSQERHKLRTNQLAVFVREAPAWVRRHARPILAGLAAVALAFAVWSFIRYRQSTQRIRAEDELSSVSGEHRRLEQAEKFDELGRVAERYGQIASTYAGSGAVPVRALYLQGDVLLTRAHKSNLAATDRPAVRQLLDEAQKAFEQAVKLDKDPLVTSLARLRLAEIAMDRDQFGRARELLAAIVDNPKTDTFVATLAQERRNRMNERPPEAIVFATAMEAPVAPGTVEPAPRDLGPSGWGQEIRVNIPTTQGDGGEPPPPGGPASTTQPDLPAPNAP